jgi:hypothetical protein|tara:strand:+ start:1039 stop:1407 length:369 start_codon:yes stop_codon:yes gene_type:complete
MFRLLSEGYMANKNKLKGTYHENWFVKWLTKIGIEAKRVPLSGALGGEYSGDIHLNINGRKLVGEVKYRDKSSFPSPFTVLTGRDIAFYKRKTGKPQTLVILSGEEFEKLMEKDNESNTTTI